MIPYPKRNSTITLREPFPRIEKYGSTKYYIKAIVNNMYEQEIRISAKQQRAVIDQLIKEDKKLTNAVVKCDEMGNFVILKHSPQSDFFNIIEEDKK